MAFSATNLLSWLKGFLSSVSSPLSGFDIDDVKMNKKDGEYAVLYQFGSAQEVKDDRTKESITDIHGNKIQLDLLLSTANVQEAFKPLLDGLNNIDKLADKNSPDYDPKAASAILAVFLGTGREQEDTNSAIKLPKLEDSIFGASDNTSENAKGGLLGTKIDNNNPLSMVGAKYAGKTWSWQSIAADMLKYSLECDVPDKDYGAIENVSLGDCTNLIGEYLVRTKTIANANEVQIDANDLVRPLLCGIQMDLKTYYDAAYAKYSKAKDVEDTYDKDQEEEEEANRQPENMAVFDKEGTMVDNIDISTPEGAAQAEQYKSQGYTVGASMHISTKLRKINGSVELLGLDSTYSPTDTLDDLEDIIYQDEFLDTLTEEPQSFAIDVDNEGYDIEQCECCEIDPCDSLWSVMQTAIVMYRNLYTIHWMAKGNDMMKLHLLAEELYKELIEEIDTLGELMVEKCGTVKGLDFAWNPVTTREYEFQESLVIIKDFIQNYVDTIDYAYCNQTSDVQSTLDEWLRFWNKQMNYFIKNQEE